MDTGEQEHADSELDQAVSSRLGRLRALPVDTSRLEKMLRAQIPHPHRFPLLQLSPLRAVAAVLLVALTFAAILWFTSGGPALASADQMAQMHQEMVAGRTSVMKADSIEEANKVLASQWPDAPDLPHPPAAHVMACCMKDIRNKKVACVLLKSEGVAVTMSVANAADMRQPRSPGIVRNGVTYHVEASKSLNMVSAVRDGRWVCLIGQLPAERLMDIAANLRFSKV